MKFHSRRQCNQPHLISELTFSLCLLLQAHILVCRALSNMLLLPWPSLPENEQQWQTRSTSHASLVAALTREYRLLRGTVNIPPRQTDLNSSQYIFLLAWSHHWRHCHCLPHFDCSLCFSFSCSESSHTADPARPERPGRQHLWGIHQITSDLLSESAGVRTSVPQHFPSIYSAARSVLVTSITTGMTAELQMF